MPTRKEDIYKKIGIDPATLQQAQAPAFPVGPVIKTNISTTTNTSTPAFINTNTPVAPKTKPSDAIYAKIGNAPKTAPLPISDDPADVQNWLLTPSSKTANSTPSEILNPGKSTYETFLKPAPYSFKPIGFSAKEAEMLPDINLPPVLGLPAKVIYDGVKYLAQGAAIGFTELRSAKEQFDANNQNRAPKPIQTLIDPTRYDLPFATGTTVESLFDRTMKQLDLYDQASPTTPKLNAVRALIEGPLTAATAVSDVGGIWSSINKSIIKNIPVADLEHRVAWQTLGRPATVEEAQVIKKNLLKSISDETRNFTTGGNDVARNIINSAEILEKQGIPAVPGKVAQAVKRGAELLESPIQDVPELLKKGLGDTPAAPYARNAGFLPGTVPENPNALPIGMSTERIRPVGYADANPTGLEPFKNFEDVSTKILGRLEGRKSVSSQFISDLTKQGNIKQAERSIISKVLESYSDNQNIPVKEFADKVKAELLPLQKLDLGAESDPLNGDMYLRYERINLPENLRGDVENYTEKIYKSPINTSAGDVHFRDVGTKNYFAHTRVEDMADGATRRVIEAQSDLFQKGRLEAESGTGAKSIMEDGGFDTRDLSQEKIKARDAEISKLDPYRNTWHERLVKEELKQAATDGKKSLQFPTGETAMSIEGLGQANRWSFFPNQDGKLIDLRPEDLKVGMEVNESATVKKWFVTEVLSDGRFKAIPERELMATPEQVAILREKKPNISLSEVVVGGKNLKYPSNRTESFDISGKADAKNPIYKFYEDTMGKYLKNNFGAVRVKDAQGVSWYEIPVAPEASSKPVVAFKKYLFSKMQGPAVENQVAKDIIKKVLEDNPVRIFFTDELINGIATGEYSDVGGINGILKPMIKLYTENGKTSITTALHEAGHYMFNNLLSESEKKLALEMAKKEISTLGKLKYKASGYKGDEYLEEYVVDKYAKAKAKAEGYKGPWAKVFESIDRVMKKIVDTFKKLVDLHKDASKKGTQGGYSNFFEPLDSNTLKTISEAKSPSVISEILVDKFKSLSPKTVQMFSKRLAKLKGTDDIMGLADVMSKMNDEVAENAVTRAYTKEYPPRESNKTPTIQEDEGLEALPPTVGELLTSKEKSSYLDNLARNIQNPQETALAFAEYDQIWDKINARAIVEYEELAIERQLLTEIQEANRAKEFLKYFGGSYDPRNTTLYDLFTQAKGTDKKVRRVDSRIEEMGFADFEKAQEGIETYLDIKDRLVQIKAQMRNLRPQVQTARLLKDFLDDVPVLQDKPAINAIEEVANQYDVADVYKDISGLEKEALDPFRIMQKFFGPKFDVVKKGIIDPFDASKGDMVDEIDRLANDLEKNVTDKYGIARGSKDAQRVRMYGEGKMGRQDLINEVGEKRAYEIIAADSFFKSFFNSLLDEANLVLSEIYPNNPSKLIPKHANYYRHLREKNSLGDALTALKGLFDSPAGISPQLAGKSETTQPRSKWLAFAQKRKGEFTDTDAIEGTLEYISSFAYLKHISPHISKFRYLRRRLADVAPTPGDPNALGIGKEPGINNFLVFLDNYSNRLAGKSHPLDRWISDTIPGGRRAMNVVSWINNRVKANTILGKASSVIAQGANIPAGVASAKQYSIPGMRRTLASIFSPNEAIKQSNFLKERNLQSLQERFKVDWADHPVQRATDEGRNFLAWMLRAGDAVGTNFIWNSHYEKALAENMADPIIYADNMTRKIVAGRGIGEVPLGQEAKIFQVIAPFQIEVGNLLWQMRDMVKGKDLAGLALLAIGNYIYNEVAEKVRGSRVVFDPINALIEGSVMLRDEDSKATGAMKLLGRQAGEILSNVPLGQTIAGQIPDSTVQAVTGWATQGTPLTKQDLFGQGDPGRFGSGFLAWKALEDPIFRFVLPYAGLQAKTTWEGLDSYINGEVRDRNNNLSFKMDKDAGSLLQAVLFGKNSTDEAQEYYDEREDLFQRVDRQKNARDEFAIEADEQWAEIKSIGREEGKDAGKKALANLAISNPKMAEKVLEIAKDEALGFNGTDRLIKQLGVENGERARFIVDKLAELENADERKAYMIELARKKLLSETVIAQIAYIKKKQAEKK